MDPNQNDPMAGNTTPTVDPNATVPTPVTGDVNTPVAPVEPVVTNEAPDVTPGVPAAPAEPEAAPMSTPAPTVGEEQPGGVNNG